MLNYYVSMQDSLHEEITEQIMQKLPAENYIA